MGQEFSIYMDCCCLNRPGDDQKFDSGYGDYTKERHNWLNQLTIEEISDEIKSLKNCGSQQRLTHD